MAEIIWETSAGQWMPLRLEHRMPQWFSADPETGRRLLVRAGGDWVEPPPAKLVVHRAGAKSGLPIRGGIARLAAWAWMYRSYAAKDWVRYLASYGLPIRLGRYPPSASDRDIAVLRRAVSNVAGDAAAVVPEGMAIDFPVAPGAAGRTDLWERLMRYHDERISIVVLGQTLTTETQGGGAYALGRVHDLVRHDIESSDARQLEETLERDLVRPLVALNGGPRDAWPRVVIERPAQEDARQLAETLRILVSLGLTVRTDEVRARLGWEAPGPDDETLSAPAAQPPAPPDASLAASLAVALGRAGSPPDGDAIDAAVDAAMDGWVPLAAPMVDPIRDAVRETLDAGGSLADLRSRLPALIDRMDDDALVRLLHRLTASARLSGAA